MWITATFYYDDGTPATGLSPLPLVYIWNIGTKALIINGLSSEELSNGTYRYWFDEVSGQAYHTLFDAGIVSELSGRYSIGDSEPDYNIAIQNIQTTSNIIEAYSIELSGTLQTVKTNTETIETSITNLDTSVTNEILALSGSLNSNIDNTEIVLKNDILATSGALNTSITNSTTTLSNQIFATSGSLALDIKNLSGVLMNELTTVYTGVTEVAGQVWDIVLTQHITTGTTGEALSNAVNAANDFKGYGK
jgi:hypothetical protein